MRVLVVEDSAYQRLRIVEALRGATGVTEVEAVGTGEEAIRRLLTIDFGLVTLDLGLPGMDGHAVLRWIMANRPLPVVIISSDREERSALMALEAGALDVLPKAGASPRASAAGGRSSPKSSKGRGPFRWRASFGGRPPVPASRRSAARSRDRRDTCRRSAPRRVSSSPPRREARRRFGSSS